MPHDDMSDEDKALFRQAMASIKPLGPNKKVASIEKKPLPPTKRSTPVEPIAEPTKYHLSNYYQQEVGPEDTLAYSVDGFPKKRFTQLKNGGIQWEARLDLHGLHADMAERALCKFIEQEYQQHHRCVLIIHGKGQIPVLKNLVNHWLKQIPQVIAFHSTLPRHGGTGALYVLLKRDRFF